jgi:CRISPR system Cascade subunit CasC
MKTLIEIHAIQNFAPSNLNRSDTGAPKDAYFGGTNRARISSQCIKRAVRQHFASMVRQGTLRPEDLATRTKRLLEAVTTRLVGLGRPSEEAKAKTTLALAAVELSIKDDDKTQYLLFLGEREIAGITQIIHDQWETIVAPEATTVEGKKAPKAKKQGSQAASPELKAALDRVFNGGKALDVALFGRMLADMPKKNEEAACQVAHAISTHAVEREFDYYTAVDDLKPDDTPGADMIGTVEFNSACFYRYAVIDWEKLVENLQGDLDLAVRGLQAFLEGFVVAEPTGKQNSFAAHNPPEFVAISVRHDSAPRSLANAFETALRVPRGESISQLSAQKLVDKGISLQKAFGGEGKTWVLNLVEAKLGEFGMAEASLQDLLQRPLAEVRPR